MQNLNVLIVDHDEDGRQRLSRFLSAHGYNVECLSSGQEVLDRLQSANRPCAMILDLLMPGMDGLEVLAQMQKDGHQVPTIVLAPISQIRTVVKAMRLGARDYLCRPSEDQELESALAAAIEEAPAVSDRELGPQDGGLEFGSTNPAMLRIRSIALEVADTDVPVLILGESGVGKEVLARFIHQHSERSDRAFIKVNCAALPADLLESELFGHERGSFTGALHQKKGKFELANGGSILLDEIGEMSPHLQAKLLHVLQDTECTRVGGTQPIPVTARVLAATNRHLEDAVARGQFREDLFYRLNVINLTVPPLRERREDIPQLCRWFLQKYREQYHRRGPSELPKRLGERFQNYSWPGNVRQLENLIKRHVILPDEDTALEELVEPVPASDVTVPGPEADLSLKAISKHAAEQTEKELIYRTLQEMNWNRRQAAKKLNMCYKSLLNKLHRWQAQPQALAQSAGTGIGAGDRAES
jgi:DNA-binding NtrC family response regulator